ncbi:ribose-5-phosphate isomerase RpiA [Sphingomonas sp. EC-HK361]|uniref:ribose-5-phosphate isomerase RpiA n=1 Tax=Sphingomonas sp. EC-HK361 TaxID=2038397 RepID=UPI00125FD429|nr:ribose-5-phosphate isomerase RpiA [Sphingomonas sp. EC-HK361]
MVDDDKRLAAEAAVSEIAPGMLVGLGTGSTAAYAIRAIGERRLDIAAVATSRASEALARSVGIRVVDFADVTRVDVTIDGADEIDDRFFAIKGAGGAMLREKIVAAASRRMIIVADGTKRVAAIGAAKLPVEILPFARASTIAALEALGAEVTIRAGFRTDQGNIVADCRFATFPDPHDLARAIDAIPGALGHGLFLSEVDAACIATDGIVTRLERAPRSG